MKTGHFYTYEDQYGIRVAAVTNAPKSAQWAAYHCPETFTSRAAAESWIRGVCAEGAVWTPGGKQEAA
jgi:hypothetical protein